MLVVYTWHTSAFKGTSIFLEEHSTILLEIFWKDSFGTPFALGLAVRSIVFSTSDTLQP